MLLKILWFGLFIVAAKKQKEEESHCVKETVNVFTVCRVTVWHTGNPPTYEEMAELSQEERIEEARPLLCPCRQGFLSGACPVIVKKFVQPFYHKNLCINFVPEEYDD